MQLASCYITSQGSHLRETAVFFFLNIVYHFEK